MHARSSPVGGARDAEAGRRPYRGRMSIGHTRSIAADRRIELIHGDITEQAVDAIANAANEALRGGGGVDGAIHRAAGPGLEEECRPFAPIRAGQSVITGAHRLPNRYNGIRIKP